MTARGAGHQRAHARPQDAHPRVWEVLVQRAEERLVSVVDQVVDLIDQTEATRIQQAAIRSVLNGEDEQDRAAWLSDEVQRHPRDVRRALRIERMHQRGGPNTAGELAVRSLVAALDGRAAAPGSGEELAVVKEERQLLDLPRAEAFARLAEAVPELLRIGPADLDAICAEAEDPPQSPGDRVFRHLVGGFELPWRTEVSHAAARRLNSIVGPRAMSSASPIRRSQIAFTLATLHTADEAIRRRSGDE